MDKTPATIAPVDAVRMKHLDPNASISVAIGPKDETGGVMIPIEHMGAAESNGWYLCHDDADDLNPKKLTVDQQADEKELARLIAEEEAEKVRAEKAAKKKADKDEADRLVAEKAAADAAEAKRVADEKAAADLADAEAAESVEEAQGGTGEGAQSGENTGEGEPAKTPEAPKVTDDPKAKPTRRKLGG